MGTTADKLNKLKQTKSDIKAAIIAKGVAVPDETTFADYATKISLIPTGVTPTGNIELTQQTGTDVTNYATASVKSGAVSTPATTKQQSAPTFTQDGNVITATVAATSVNVTPNVSTAGWISAGTAGTITMSANTADYTIPTGTATTPATTQQQSQPTITVSSAGLITASVAATSVNVTPEVSAGYISAGTAGTITMSANSNTSQLSVQAAKTITPTSSSQTAVAAGKYTTGAITVAAVPTETGSATDNGTFTPTSGKFYSQFTVNVSYNTFRTGSGAPSSSLGSDGDIYFDIS